MSNTQTEKKHISDIVKFMIDPRYCIEKVTFAANGGATAGLNCGQVLEASTTNKIACTTEASADSVLLENITLAEAIAGCSKIAIVRGPALINTDELTHTDSTAAAAALAALAALGIRAVTEPTYTQEGTEVES
jgi:hypothetical protein